LKKPTAYNLDGIKDRIKDRLQFLKEVSSRHESDLDRAYDDMITSKMEIDKFEGSLPETANNHRYYQDLRGYVTDLVECYDEKLLSIKYLEDKFYKSKSDMTKKADGAKTTRRKRSNEGAVLKFKTSFTDEP